MNTKNKGSKTSVVCTQSADKKTQDYQLPKYFKEQCLSENGHVYLDISFKNGIRIEKPLFESGKDGVTDEWLMEVDLLDGKMIGNEIQEGRLKDFSLLRVKDECCDSYIFLHSKNRQKSVHQQAFPGEMVLSPKAQIVRDVVESLPAKQRFVYELRCGRTYPMSFPDIAECFAEFFHCHASDDSVRNLFKKIQQKVCKALNEWPEKKRK